MTMEISSTPGQESDTGDHFGMDELCNFEAPQMCMSGDTFHKADVENRVSSSHCSPESSDAIIGNKQFQEDCNLQGVALLDGSTFQTVFQTIPLEELVLWINAGGSAMAASDFSSGIDCHFYGGDVLRTGEDISHTNNPSLYQTARYGNFSYCIENLSPGIYYVDLHFAEIIFTNGPPGMRIFDVYVQDRKIISKLDIYSKVGSNTPLVLMNVKATIEGKKGLSVSFRAFVGSPTVNGICIRKSYIQGLKQLCMGSSQDLATDDDSCSNNLMGPPESSDIENSMLDEKGGQRKLKTAREYELRIQELKNEVHQAWLSVQDANRQIEKLQNELDCKSFHADSLEGKLNTLTGMRYAAEQEKQICISKLIEISSQFKLLKQEYKILSKEAHVWASSFPQIHIITESLQSLVKEHKELKQKFVKQAQDLRSYYNQVLEMKGNIRVFCRCRPVNKVELNSGASSVVEFSLAQDNELVVWSNGTKKFFKFDRVFTPSNNQVDVYMDTAPVVVSVLDGYNVCIFAYGQTGTGKTFTMEGTEYDRGVNYRTLEELFQLAAERAGHFKYDLSVSVLEVYNEQIRDLLAPPLTLGQAPKKLEIKQMGEGVHHIPGLTVSQVQSIDEVWGVLRTGSSARAVGSTNSNEHSSRSHFMLCVMVKGENLFTGECTRSKLWLVDLAGSERIAKTNVQDERLKETQNINKSLSALGDVIYALTTKSSHIPYRNSKLTHILQDSLGGESKTLMFVQISPVEQDVGETLCSLNFASRVRGVELGPARKHLDSIELVKYKQLAEKSKQDGKVKDDSLRNLGAALKMKEQACCALSDKVTEQQILIEKLKNELKMKGISQLPHMGVQQGKQLDVVSEVTALGMENKKEINDKPSQKGGMEYDQAKIVVPSPPLARIARKPGRASICGVPRRRPSLVGAMVNILPQRVASISKIDGLESIRSSSESFGDSFGDENMPAPQRTAAPVIPSIWKKGSSITANTVVRRSIPRKVHFKSPHLQPSYLKTAGVSPCHHLQIDGDSRSNLKKRDQHAQQQGERQGVNKMRRVSIATIMGRGPPLFTQQQQQQQLVSGLNSATTSFTSAGLQQPPPPVLGVAQRVLVTKKEVGSSLYNRERRWNR